MSLTQAQNIKKVKEWTMESAAEHIALLRSVDNDGFLEDARQVSRDPTKRDSCDYRKSMKFFDLVPRRWRGFIRILLFDMMMQR